MSTKTDTLTKIEIKEPTLWNVIIFNDDKTPMDFVTGLLESIFQKSNREAIEIMLTIHNNGSAVAGTYFYELAEQKGVEATTIARDEGWPLVIKLEAN